VRLKLLLLASLAHFLWGEAHILVYHRFADPRYPSTNTSLAELEREFAYLKRHGYKVIPLSRLVEALKKGEPVDDRWVVLTIDDGYKSFLRALPLFKKYGYPFTIFVATKPIEGHYGDFLSWEQLKEVANYGEVGLHSHAHPHLCDLSDKKIADDTKKGIELFKKRLGFAPKSYAYPYGEYDERVRRVVAGLGFEAICNQNRGAVGDKSDPFDLDRVAMVGRANLKSALRIGHLEAEWMEPKRYPANKTLRRIEVRIDPAIKRAQIYITGYGWHDVPVKNGVAQLDGAFRLDRDRVRVIIKAKNSKMNTKILVRSRNGTQ
jgi:peptidoglycan/xylan/chitin deacetylase (PgdA/CDA1 family)